MISDPYANGLTRFASAVRSGELSFEQATKASLSRIELLEPSLQAFECVDNTRAIETAKSLDNLLTNGTDLGPLMGVTIAVKDIIAVDGMPTTNGSNHAPDHLKLAEGTLIRQLRAAGCIIIGKTKTVEFALGATGINESRGTPWNPWDATTHRIPGGSSSGSAVAVASGMCGFALGTDTGGSVRIPACYNGITGHKTTLGLWPTDGIFPLCSTFDSVGPLCHTVEDAYVIHRVVTGMPISTPQTPLSLSGLRFGIPKQYFQDDLDAQVKDAFNHAIESLSSAGVVFTEIDLPEAPERETLMPVIIGAEMISALTAEGFKEAFDGMDTVTRSRAAIGLEVKAHDYVSAKKRVAEIQKLVSEKCAHIDALISPTCPMLPIAMNQIAESETVASKALLSSRNTQPGNLFGMCATSLPLPGLARTGTGLPTGFQIMTLSGQDDRLLEVSAAVQGHIGIPARPDLATFIA